MSKKTFIFRDEVYPDVERSLKNKGNQLIRYIEKYMDKNSDVLLDSGIGKRLFFRDEDRDIIFKTTNTRPTDIEKYIKDTKLVDKTWVILNKPENWVMVNIMKYYHDKKDEKKLKLVMMYYLLSQYSSIQYSFFNYIPNENVMAYTINNLSNKYDIKRLGNLFKSFEKLLDTYYETYASMLDDDNFHDENIKDFLLGIRTRVQNMVRGIANEFYDNLDKGKYLNTETSSTDEDDFYETDNISFQVNRLTDRVSNYIISSRVDQSVAAMAARISNIGRNVTISSLENIIANENETITELIRLILQQYLAKDNNPRASITSNRFLNYCNNLYASNNTREKDIIRIKEILDIWLQNNSEKYVATERVATKSNFRKAIFLYFVFMIQKVDSHR